MDFRSYPKIDLHCHLDGSIPLEMARQELIQQEIEKNQGKDCKRQFDIENLRQQMVAPDLCHDLADYLARFNLPILCVQTARGLENAAYALAKNAAEENVRYLETRYAPESCSGQGMTYIETMEAVERGLAKARAEHPIETGIIICGMRHLPAEKNIAAVKAAREMLGSGVVAVDIAGDEKAFTNFQVREMFDHARKIGMPFTMHAGECGRAENIREAIELGAKRVGHGIAMRGNAELIELCRQKRIGIEMCPISNVQTRAIDNLSDYPFLDYYKKGLMVSVNTDNRTVSNTSSTKEWETLSQTCPIDEEIMKETYRRSVEIAFASDQVKDRLLKAIDGKRFV